MAMPIATATASNPNMMVRISCRPRAFPLPLLSLEVPWLFLSVGSDSVEVVDVEEDDSDELSFAVVEG